jgi:hypothetical protein
MASIMRHKGARGQLCFSTLKQCIQFVNEKSFQRKNITGWQDSQDKKKCGKAGCRHASRKTHPDHPNILLFLLLKHKIIHGAEGV